MGISRLKTALLGLCYSQALWLWACDVGSREHTPPSQAGTEAIASTPAALAAENDAPSYCPDPPNYAAGDKVEAFTSPTGFFNVHFTRKGVHAVPMADSDRDGTPDYVQTVAREFDAVEQFYKELGYREARGSSRDTGARFDVYLQDFPTSADGQYCKTQCNDDACGGYMLLENDFDGRNYASQAAAIRLVASHEFFHAIQAAYTVQASLNFAEGTAVWASEAFDPDTGDLDYQVPAYLAQPERPLGQDATGTFDGFGYGVSLFFQYLDERYGRDVIRELWETVTDDSWVDALDSVLMQHDSSLAQAYGEFVQWNLYTGARADAEHSYAYGEDYPEVDEQSIDSGFNLETVRIFPLAARYYKLRATSPSTIAALVRVPNNGNKLGLQLGVALEHDGHITQLASAPMTASLRVELPLAAADTLHVVLFNTEHTGESVRPSLCIGTASEVAACSGEATTVKADDTGGCSVAGLQPSASGRGWWFLCGGFVLLRMRRRVKGVSPQPRSQPT
ncbi:MAG: hypothetical protein RL701_421 [Pseudomonadota bacterium]